MGGPGGLHQKEYRQKDQGGCVRDSNETKNYTINIEFPRPTSSTAEIRCQELNLQGKMILYIRVRRGGI